MKLQALGVEFSYNSRPVLNGVNLSIEPGQFVSIVGPNGSGKSTLLRCIDRILTPRRGVIRINERELKHFSSRELAQAVGYVPQNETGNHGITVFEMVLMGRKPYGDWGPGPDDLRKTAALIDRLGLKELAQRGIDTLSGGQRQKVCIGRALAQEAELILLDEPTANLDLKRQLEVLDLLKEETCRDRSVLAAVHDLNLAAQYSDQLIMLRNGEIFSAGGTEILNEENIEAVYGVKVNLISNGAQRVIIPIKTAGVNR